MLSTLANFAQDYTTGYYTYSTPTTDTPQIPIGFFIVYSLFALVTSIITIVGMWKVYEKAGRPGWAAIVPFYNTLQMIWMVGLPWWWILLLFIPLVNIVVYIMLYNKISKAFGGGIGTTLLLIFLPFIGFPVLGFGKAQYQLATDAQDVPVPPAVPPVPPTVPPAA